MCIIHLQACLQHPIPFDVSVCWYNSVQEYKTRDWKHGDKLFSWCLQHLGNAPM